MVTKTTRKRNQHQALSSNTLLKLAFSNMLTLRKIPYSPLLSLVYTITRWAKGHRQNVLGLIWKVHSCEVFLQLFLPLYYHAII